MKAPSIFTGMSVKLTNAENRKELQPFLNQYGILVKWRTKENDDEEGYVQFENGRTSERYWINFDSLDD